MLRLAVPVIALLLGALVAAMLWQHRRYVHARREFVQDRQPLFHSSEVFHVVIFLELARGRDLLDSVRELRRVLEEHEGVQLVYAGKVVLNARPSSQLVDAFGEEVPWDAIVLVQLPSRDAWHQLATAGELKRGLAGFERTYAHGMKRSALRNLMVPQGLLAKRIQQIVTRAPSQVPFEPAPKQEWRIPQEAPFERLSEEQELGRHAAVVVNLVLPGTAEQVEADRGYVERMFGLMAEVGNGPMHMGRAVTLEHDTDFHQVAIVYYPGVEYFRSMAESRFFQGIIAGKQLGDTQASITVPILGGL
jgi:hypothetical protein